MRSFLYMIGPPFLFSKNDSNFISKATKIINGDKMIIKILELKMSNERFKIFPHPSNGVCLISIIGSPLKIPASNFAVCNVVGMNLYEMLLMAQ